MLSLMFVVVVGGGVVGVVMLVVLAMLISEMVVVMVAASEFMGAFRFCFFPFRLSRLPLTPVWTPRDADDSYAMAERRQTWRMPKQQRCRLCLLLD